jgi:hypothetical protein
VDQSNGSGNASATNGSGTTTNGSGTTTNGPGASTGADSTAGTHGATSSGQASSGASSATSTSTSGATTSGQASTSASATAATGGSTGTTGGSSGTTGGTSGVLPPVSTVAGNGQPGFFDGTGGPSGTAEFYSPLQIAVDANDNVYVADSKNNRIRVVAPNGATSTLAGNGNASYFDGTGGASGTTEFYGASGVALGLGQLFVGDFSNDRVRQVMVSGGATTTLPATELLAPWTAREEPPAPRNSRGRTAWPWMATATCTSPTRTTSGFEWIAPNGTTSTLAGNAMPVTSTASGPGRSSTCRGAWPSTALATSTSSTVATIASERSLPAGNTTTLAGNGMPGYMDGTGGASGTAEFYEPQGLAVDGFGNVYVADYGNNRIRVIAPNGTTTTLAGNGMAGYMDGTAGASGTAEFNNPGGVALDNNGNVYVADFGNNRIRLIKQ